MIKKETNDGTPSPSSPLDDLYRRIEGAVRRALADALEAAVRRALKDALGDAGGKARPLPAKLLRFPDLFERGIAKSKMTLHRLIRDEGFPAGILVTPNSRAWTEELVNDWVANRPSAKKELGCASRTSPRARGLKHRKAPKPAAIGARELLGVLVIWAKTTKPPATLFRLKVQPAGLWRRGGRAFAGGRI